MQRLFHLIKIILSDKRISVFIVLIAIAGRVIQLVFFYNIRVDHSFQVFATQNFTDGHGISLSYVLPHDLTTTIYEPLINWPPGYSVLLAPFYILYGYDYVAAGITLDIVSGIIFLLVSRQILRVFHIPIYLINISTLITGFFIYQFYFVASSDAIAITFFLAAILFGLLLLKSSAKWIRNIFLLVISLFLCAFIKYLFMPAVFVIPLFLFAKGWGMKELYLKKAGIYAFAALAILLSGLLLYQKYSSGSAGYISQPERGFFPEHLLTAYPFIPAAFIKPDTIGIFINLYSGIGKFIYQLFQIINIIILVIGFIYFLRRLLKEKLQHGSLTVNFSFIFLLLSGTIILLLGILSVRVAKEVWENNILWTYIEESRYYGLLTILAQLGLFILYHYFRPRQIRFVKYIFFFLLFLLLVETMRGILLDINRVSKFGKEEYSWQYEKRLQEHTSAIIKNKMRDKGIEHLVVTGSTYMKSRINLYHRVTVLNDIFSINNVNSVNSKEPAMLFTVLHKKDLEKFAPFISSDQVEALGNFDNFYFYSLYVYPH